MSQPGIPASTLPEEEAVDHVLGLVTREDDVADLVKLPLSALVETVGADLLEDLNAATQAAVGAKNDVQQIYDDFNLAAPAQISSIESAGATEVAAVNAAGATQVDRITGTVPDNLYSSTADALSNGVAGFASLVGGSGGTNGTFDVVFSGGGGTGAAARFVVAGGALVSILRTARGKNYTSPPTMSFAASSGLSGASATAVISQNQPPGTLFGVVPGSNDNAFDLFENVGGTATPRASRPVSQFDQSLRVQATLEQADVPLLLNGDGTPLVLYDGKENVIIESLPRIPSVRQTLLARSGSPLALTQRLGVPNWGQSNSEGGGYNQRVSTTAFYTSLALTFTNGPRPDLVPTNFNGEQALTETTQAAGSGATPGGESPASGFASRFIENGVADGNWTLASAPKLFISNPGYSGQDITRFLSTGFVYPRLSTHITNAKARATAAGETYNVPVLPWYQGESDAESDTTNRATYLSRSIQVHTDAIASIKAATGQTNDPVMIFMQTTFSARRPTNPGAIALAQYDLHNGTTRFCAGPSYAYPHFDLYHPNAIGRRLIGEKMGQVAKIVIVDHLAWTGLRPRQVWARGNEVFVRFHVPHGPLVLDVDFVPMTQDYGFRIADAGGVKTIVGAPRMVAHDTMKWTLSAALSGAARIRYALDYLYPNSTFDPVFGSTGNLRDSDPTRTTIGGADYFNWNWCVAFDLPIDQLNPSVT